MCGLLDVKNEELKKIQIIIDNCNDLRIPIPEKITEILMNDYCGLNEFSFEKKGEIKVDIPYREYHNEYQEGLEIDVDKIPKKVKTIRFVNSW